MKKKTLLAPIFIHNNNNIIHVIFEWAIILTRYKSLIAFHKISMKLFILGMPVVWLMDFHVEHFTNILQKCIFPHEIINK